MRVFGPSFFINICRNSLSIKMFASDLKALQESYQNIYEEGDGISCEMIEEVVEELIQECVEFGYTLDEASVAVENAAILYLDEAKVTYGSDTESPEQRKARAKERLGGMKSSARKAAVKTAVGRVKAKAKGAKAVAGIAASIAKDEARRAGRAATHAVSSTVQKKKAEVKGGIKRMIGGGLRAAATGIGKVAQKAAGAASRLGEEAQQLDEVSDKKVAGLLKARDRQDRDSGGRSAGFMARTRAHQAAARRNVRTGSNVTVDPILSKEEFELDALIESLVERGHTEQEAYALVSQFTFDEGYQRNPEKGEKEDRKYEPVRGEKRPMPPRGHKDREAFERWYAANVR